jgi:LysM repeat protein
MSSLVLITSSSPELTLYALLGASGAVPSEGYGGWTTVTRPKRPGVVIWEGRKPFRLSLDIILDEFIGGGSVEPQCNKLETLSLPIRKGEEPPIVKVTGDAIPTGPGTNWVINDVAWGDALRRADGKRTRQLATLDLYEHTQTSRIRDEKASSKARGKASSARKKKQSVKGKATSHPSTYTVKSGDTISTIAARKLGSAARWHEIADLNNIRDSKSIRVGQVLKLP